MPTVAGTNVNPNMLPGGGCNPVDWLSLGGNEAAGVMQTPLMRGTPGALSAYQRRQIPQDPTAIQGVPFYIYHRNYSRGADAYSPKFGVLNYDPIGAGIVSTAKLPVIAGPGARYQFGAIFFDVQSIPTTVHMSPSMTQQSVDALLAQSRASAMYATTG